MARILFVGQNDAIIILFGKIAQEIPSTHQTEIVSCYGRTYESMLQHEAREKELIVVGVGGNPKDAKLGVDVLQYATRRLFPKSAIGVCIDECGYAYSRASMQYCDPTRVRFGIFVGNRTQFPLAHDYVRVGGENKLFVPTPWSPTDLASITAVVDKATNRSVSSI